jgi:hypothetical protein
VKPTPTAEDSWALAGEPLPQEFARRAKPVAAGLVDDAAAYAAAPVRADEFWSNDDDWLAWDAEGWDAIDGSPNT